MVLRQLQTTWWRLVQHGSHFGMCACLPLHARDRKMPSGSKRTVGSEMLGVFAKSTRRKKQAQASNASKKLSKARHTQDARIVARPNPKLVCPHSGYPRFPWEGPTNTRIWSDDFGHQARVDRSSSSCPRVSCWLCHEFFRPQVEIYLSSQSSPHFITRSDPYRKMTRPLALQSLQSSTCRSAALHLQKGCKYQAAWDCCT